MTVVLVHGNPETDAIWDDLRQHLAHHDEVIALKPPGFGAPVLEGFVATSDAYTDWLIEQIDRLPGPIDLVGHDWGGGHVFRAVQSRPDLVRSWTMDIAGCFDPEYVWHERAQVWQTPGAGEDAIAHMLAMPVEERTIGYQRLGMTPAAARSCAEAFNEDMGRCILSLYRSARQPRMSEWARDLTALRSRPGLVIIATEDHYTGGETLARRTAERAGAQVAVLSGLGHWWMCQDPRAGAQALDAFLNRLS